MKKFDHPILAYLIISIISLICAILLFQVGGSLAEITGNDKTLLGFSFKAGGAVAGFIIIFLLSQKALLKLKEDQRKESPSINVKVYLQPKSNGFNRSITYQAEYKIFDGDTGDSQSYLTNPFWEAGYLTVFIKEVGEKDFLSVKIKNESSIWESESFHSRSPKIAELNQLS